MPLFKVGSLLNFRKFCPHALNQRSPAEGKGKGQKPVLEPHTKVQLLIFKAKIIKKRKMSKKMMIFYSFPFNFLWKSLMTLMTMTLMTGFLGLFKAVASIVLAGSAAA